MEEIFDRKLTFQDIQEINKKKPKYISVRSTKYLDRKILLELDDSIAIRIIGEDDELSETTREVTQRDLYYKEEILSILSLYEEYEAGIHKDWSDLHKALYVYARMVAEYDVASSKRTAESSMSGNSSTLKSIYTANPDSKGIARNFRELLDRIGIPCRYVENIEKAYAWNEIRIDGTYYPVDVAMDSKISHQKGPGNILVHNFGKNPEFYEYPEHQLKTKPQELKLLDRDSVQKALNEVVDQIVLDHSKRRELVRQNITIPVQSKELKGIFKGDTISQKTLEELSTLKISLTDDKTESLISELKTIGTYYPEILNNVEIVNNNTQPVNMQEVVDGIYEAKSVGQDIVIDPINLTIASSFEEDFRIDLSKVPQVAEDVTKRIDDDLSGQSVTFRNTDTSKPMRVPDFKTKPSDGLSGIAFEGFDVEGLDLRDTKVNRLSFDGSTNLDKVIPAVDVSYDIAFKAMSASELTSALSNFRIHKLTVRNVDLHDRPILQELSANPELTEIVINRANLNNLDGLENFDGRLYFLNLMANELTVNDIERVQNFRKTNPLLESYLSDNTPFIRTISSLTPISDETYNFIAEYSRQRAENFGIHNKEDAVDYLLWGRTNMPYYIKDARIIRDSLKLIHNPMMVENDTELETFDFTQDYVKDGTLLLTPAQLKHLIAIGKTVPQTVRLRLESTVDLSAAEVNNLALRASSLGINIREVQIVDPTKHSNRNQMAPYTLSQYAYIRDTLDLLINGINPTDSDIDKFATVYQRLMDSITYDHDAIKDDNSAESKYYAEKRDTCRNLLQGLEEGKCVCSGYADILRNALLMVGINAENVSGFTGRNSRGELIGAHAWNRVQLDDGTGTKRWYHTDLTWCAGRSPADMERVTLRGDNCTDFTDKHITNALALPTVSSTDFDRTLLRTAFTKARANSFNIKNRQSQIDIPADPELQIEILDQDRILAEYTRRRNDMCAKYYGDREYRREYMERSRRFRAHEVELNPGTVASYRTIDDYPEREEDEQFLLLDKYAECLERMTKYESGNTSVYQGTPDQIADALEKDREYVETRNHTFNKHSNMRSNLATLGKYGERVPYIPHQDGVLKNIGRVALNAGILTRNLVAPIYRGVGRFIAVPIHRLVVRDRDASPFRNNWYHRMVARRDYFTEQNNSTNPNHPIRNGMKARAEAIFKAKEGNKAVLNAGAFEIQSNIVRQERERNVIHSLTNQSNEYAMQITALQNEISAHSTAPNIDDARRALQEKINKKATIDNRISNLSNNRTGISQTDAISDAQHDIAVKEEVTMKTTVIKGFAKGLAVKYVGPKIHDWLAKRGTKTITEQTTVMETVEKQRWVEPTYKEEPVPIYEEVLDTNKSMSQMMEANSGKSVTGFYSVYGGERGGASYTLTGNENITAIFEARGKGGTGYSDIVGLKAPTLVDKTFDSSLLTESGLLNQNITINELLEVVKGEGVDASAIANMYVSVGDRYWVKLSELTTDWTADLQAGVASDLITKVQVGTRLERVLDVAGHYEKYTDYIPKLASVSHTITDDTLAKLSDTVLRAGAYADGVIDVGENLRFSSTDVRNNKAMPRNYAFNRDADIPTSRREFRSQMERERGI